MRHKKKMTCFRFYPSLIKAIRDAADEQGVTMTDLVTTAVTLHLHRVKNDQA